MKIFRGEAVPIQIIWSFRYLCVVLWLITFIFDTLYFGIPHIPTQVASYLARVADAKFEDEAMSDGAAAPEPSNDAFSPEDEANSMFFGGSLEPAGSEQGPSSSSATLLLRGDQQFLYQNSSVVTPTGAAPASLVQRKQPNVVLSTLLAAPGAAGPLSGGSSGGGRGGSSSSRGGGILFGRNELDLQSAVTNEPQPLKKSADVVDFDLLDGPAARLENKVGRDDQTRIARTVYICTLHNTYNTTPANRHMYG